MERSSTQNATAQGQRPGHRDMMFCHECADEWYRDEHGLTCPECGSDFTEIIEENNDPRDSVMFGHDGEESESIPDLEDLPPHMRSQQNPFQGDDPDDSDISNFHFTQTAPGRFNVQATITRSVSPQGLQGGMAPGSIGGFMSILNGLSGAGNRAQTLGQGQTLGQTLGQTQSQGQQRGQGEGLFSDPSTASQPRVHTSRFTYHGGARLVPRDANNPEPRIEPVDDITNVMAGLMAALGAPPGSVRTQPTQQGGAEATFHGEHNHDNGPMAAHPFLQLFTSMGLLGGPGGQMGDFVYSQEGLDRIVSQLMEQTATSNAPGPASQSDIDSLPRKTITQEVLGPEGKAECSICMDEVALNDQVTELPCKHWFHHQCVAAWLQEHDTCPHCRKGITKQPEEASGSTSGQETSQGVSATRQMPGAFDTNNSYYGDASGNANSNHGDGSVSDRARRGWFGPQS